MTTPKINQDERRALCRRLASGDVSARHALADLYEQAGYRHLAGVIRNGSLGAAIGHAQMVLTPDVYRTREG